MEKKVLKIPIAYWFVSVSGHKEHYAPGTVIQLWESYNWNVSFLTFFPYVMLFQVRLPEYISWYLVE